MNIIQTVPSIAQQSSGPSYSVVRLCESIQQLDGRVQLAAMEWGRLNSQPDFLQTFPAGFGPRKLGRSPRLLAWLDRQAARGDISILHNHGMWQFNSIYPAKIARKYGIPFVASPRGSLSKYAFESGSFTKRIFWPLFQRSAFQTAACFHATADHEFEDIRRMGFTQPVAIIPNGVDIPEDCQQGSSRLRTLLFLGRIHQIKGLDILLRAWAEVHLRFPDWQLQIAGSDTGNHGPSGYLAHLKSLALRLNVERIHFSGELLGSEKMLAFRNAELFVLPSRSENFGLAVAESLASATPVVVTHGTPWRGLVSRRAGWHIEFGVESLARCLIDAMRLPQTQLRDMGLAGREWMENDFAWPQIAAQMMEMYRWLMTPSTCLPACVRID